MIDVYDFIETSPTEDLARIKKRIDEELTRRNNEERERLIANFRKAWDGLKDAGIRISYCEEYEDDIAHLDYWDGFDFD